jgi:hypothetical protein
LDTLKQPTSRLGSVADFAESNAFVILILGICCGVLALFERSRLGDDSWYTVLAGRVIVHSGLPHRNVWTLIAGGHSWTDQQWLAQLAGYGVWWLGGWRLALLCSTICFVGAFVILAATARRLGASDSATAVGVLVCFLAGLSNTEFRTELPAYLLFAMVFSLLLLDERQPSRRVYLVFPLLVLWANLHGSVVLGAGLIALRGVVLVVSGRRTHTPARGWLPRAAAFVVAPWVCILLSPYGFALPSYYKSVLDDPSLATAGEWMPTTTHNQPLYFILLFLGLWLVYRSRRMLTPFHELAFTATAIGGALAIRNVVWFALAGGVALPLAIQSLWTPAEARRKRALNVGLACVGCVVTIGAIAAVSSHPNTWYTSEYPSAAARVVERTMSSSPHLRVLATDEDADWLLFEDPATMGRMAYDVRYELLDAKEFSMLADLRDQSGPTWAEAETGYGLLVLDPFSEKQLVASVVRQPGSRVLYRDKYVIVIRRPPGAVPGVS